MTLSAQRMNIASKIARTTFWHTLIGERPAKEQLSVDTASETYEVRRKFEGFLAWPTMP
jgi:hypothetical protein